MKRLDPAKVFVQYRDTIMPNEPIMGRKYTITHSDDTAQLFVFVSKNYAEDQISEMRDDVRLAWELSDNGLALIGCVIVDSDDVKGNSFIRNKIFLKEMPKALQSLRRADRFLFMNQPGLDNTPVFIRFISNKPAYAKTYDFGIIGNYK